MASVCGKRLGESGCQGAALNGPDAVQASRIGGKADGKGSEAQGRVEAPEAQGQGDEAPEAQGQDEETGNPSGLGSSKDRPKRQKVR